jgi:hypothetical protein
MESSINSKMAVIGAIYQQTCLPTPPYSGITNNGEQRESLKKSCTIYTGKYANRQKKTSMDNFNNY